jgi:MFS transporter, DHA2 family, methylenomycin A resistance protein
VRRAVEDRGLLALVAICLGYFLVMVDTTIVTVALPAIGDSFGGGASLLMWTVDAYTIFFAAFVLGGGALADRLGARRVYVYGTVLFALGSAVCALATAGWILIGARALQGIGAAALMPSSLTLIQSTYKNARKQARAIGIWGGLGGVAAAFGPLLGGVLVTSVGWRTVFWINVPLAAAAIVLARCTLAETPRTSVVNSDIGGQASLATALILLVAGIIGLGHSSKDGPILLGVLLTVTGVVLVSVFILRERRRTAPIFETDLLRNRGLRTAVLTGFTLNFGFYGQFFLVTIYLHQVRHVSALLTGIILAVEACGAIIGSPFAGWTTHRFGPRATMIIGLAAGATGFLLLAVVREDTPLALVAGALFVVGFGIDAAMVAATALTLRVTPSGSTGVATGLLNTMRQIGSALGVAAFGALATSTGSFNSGFVTAMIFAALCYLFGVLLSTTAPPRANLSTLKR